MQSTTIRALFVVVLAAVVGLAAGTALQPTQTTAATTYTRAWSCMGRDFRPIVDDQPFDYWGAMLTGDGFFQCDADIPHKAVVTRVRFTVRDAYNGYVAAEVLNCALGRISLIAATAGATNYLASVPGTGDGAAPGNVRLTTTSIAFATIDRTNFAYYLTCELDYTGASPNIGLWGADVTYKITSANG